MAKSPGESNSAKPAVKTSGVSKAAKPAASGAAAPAPDQKKPKITAVEARKKLKGGGKKESETPENAGAVSEPPAEAIGGKPKKKPVPAMNLPKDLSKQVGLKAEGETSETPNERPKHNINVAIHTTGRDGQETRKVRMVLTLAVLAVVAVLAGVVFLQMRDPAEGTKSALNVREREHFRAALAELKSSNSKVLADRPTGSAVMQALSDLLTTKLNTASGGKPDPKTMPDNPELYSLYLAAQFIDGYEQPVRVSVVAGKVVIRSAGADRIDQTGGDSATARGDDWVVSE